MPLRPSEIYQDGVLVGTGSYEISDEQVRREELEQRARAALTANATFLAIASPTNAQTLAQVQRLTRENNLLIRLLLGLLDTTEGT